MPIDLIVFAVGLGLTALLLAVAVWLYGRRRGLSFRRAWRDLVTPPAHLDAERARSASLLGGVLRQFLAILLLLGPLVAVVLGGAEGRAIFLILACAVAFNLALYLLLVRGLVYVASRAFPIGLFLMLTWAITNSRLTGPLASAYLLVIISAGLLLGGRAAIAFAVLCMAALPAVYFLAPPAGLPFGARLAGMWLVYSSVFMLSALLLALAANRIREGLTQADLLREAEAAHARALAASLEAERKRAQQMALLADISRRLTGLTDPSALIDEVVRRVVEGLHYEHVALFLVEGDSLAQRAGHGLFAVDAAPPAAADQGVVAWAARTGETGWVQAAGSDERYLPRPEVAMVCAVAVPLRLSKSVVGILNVESARPVAFDATDVSTLESLADLIVAGLQASQLFRQLRARQHMTEALRRVGAALNASLELSTVLDAVCGETLAAFEANDVDVWLLRSEATLHWVAARGPHLKDETRGPVPLAEAAPVARAVREKRTLVLAAARGGPEARWLSAQVTHARSALVVPLIKDNRSLGALLVAEASRAQPFETEEAAAADLLAAQLAGAIENARLFTEGRRRADQLARLNDITRAALSIGDYDRLLDTLASRLSALIGSDGCYLTLWDDAQRVPLLAGGLERPGLPAAEPERVSITQRVLETRLAEVIQGVDLELYADLAPAVETGACMVLALPLIAGQQPLGAALVTFTRPDVPNPEEIAQAEQAAGQVALGLAKARALESERRRHTELETLREASLHLTSRLQLREVLEAILEQTFKLVPAQDAHIFLYDGEQLKFGAALWADGAHNVPFSVPRPAGVTDTVARTGLPLVVPNANAHPLFTEWQWGGAIVGLPLRMGERVRGVMNIAFSRPRHFDAHLLRILGLLADQAAIALENARLYEGEREQREFAEALREASVALGGTLEYEALLDRLLDQVERIVPSDAVALLFLSAETGLVQVVRERSRRSTGALMRAFAGTPGLPAADVPYLRVLLETRQPLVIPDTAAHSAWPAAPALAAVRSWAGVPIVARQQVIAFFVLARREVNYYQPQHAARLAAFAGQAALALQNANLFEAERRRAAQLSLLAEVSQQVAGTLDETELLNRVVQSMISRLGFADAAMLTWSGPNELEVVAMATTEPMAATVGYKQKADAGIIGRAVALRTVYWTNDVSQDPYYFDPGGRNVGSAMGLPLLREGELLGVLYLETSAPGSFSTSDVLAFNTLAQHVATALENARLYARARTRLHDMTALQSVSQTVASSLDLQHVIHTVVHLLHDNFGYRQVSLYQLDGEMLRLMEQVGYAEDLIIHEIPTSRGVSGRAVRTRQAQFVRDVDQDPDFLRALPEAHSEICVPLLKDRTVLGTLNVEAGPEAPLTEGDVYLLTTLAGQVTVAIENARLFTAEREQRELAEALRDASSALSGSLDFDVILDRLLDLIERVVPYDTASLLLLDPSQGQVVVARQRGYEQFGPAIAEQMARFALNVRQAGNLARMADTGRSLIIADTAAEPNWIGVAATPFVRAWAGAPIIAHGEVIAFFSLDKREPGFYQPKHAERLSAFAGQASLMLQNARLYEAQQRRAEEQRLLWLAAQDFTSGLSQADVLQAVVRHMTVAVQTSGCTVSLWDREKDHLVTLYDFDPANQQNAVPIGTLYRLADYPATRAVLESRQPQVARADDPQVDAAERDFLRANHNTEVLMLPLDTGEQVFGLVELFRAGGMPAFTEPDVQLARSLAAQAAVALENSRLHTALQENLFELDALLRANQALLSTLELDPLLDNILTAVVAAIPAAEKGRITLAEPAGERLEVRAVHGYVDARVKALWQPSGAGYEGRVLRGNQALLVADTQAEPAAWYDGGLAELSAVRSSVLAPLASKGSAGNVYGVISVEAGRPAAFSERDLRVLRAFATTAAIAIDNARLHAEVQRLAVTDSLTGLANPRAFEHALVTEFSRAQRYGYSLSLVIMDIDSFKVYNDTYGHPAGNERLKAIAEVLRASVREPDLPVRYGGEEFALLLPHTSKEGAEALAHRVREAAELAAPQRPLPGAPAPGYTLSLGVASFPLDAATAEDLVLAADYAELDAKRAGKNRVIVASPLTSAAEPLPVMPD